MALGDTIRRLRTEKGLTQGQLATYTGVDRPYISQIETGVIKKPSTKVVIAIANELGVDPDILFEAAGYLPQAPPTRPPRPFRRTPEELIRELEAVTPVLVPVTEQPAAAGYGLEGAAEYLPYMPEPSERRHKFIGVEVRGECLEPRIRAGEHVIVDTDASPRHGDVVLAVHDSEIIVKLLEKRNEDTYLIALKMRPPLKVNEDTRILGVVKMVMRRP